MPNLLLRERTVLLIGNIIGSLFFTEAYVSSFLLRKHLSGMNRFEKVLLKTLLFITLPISLKGNETVIEDFDEYNETVIEYFDENYYLTKVNFSSLPSDGKTITLPADSVITCFSFCNWLFEWTSKGSTAMRYFTRTDLRREDFQEYAGIASKFVFSLKQISLRRSLKYSFEYQVPGVAKMTISKSIVREMNDRETYIMQKGCSEIRCFDENAQIAFPNSTVVFTIGSKEFPLSGDENISYAAVEDKLSPNWPTLITCSVSQIIRSTLQSSVIYTFQKSYYVAKASTHVEVVWNKANVSGWRGPYHPQDTLACRVISNIPFLTLQFFIPGSKINNRRWKYTGKNNFTTPSHQLENIEEDKELYCLVVWKSCRDQNDTLDDRHHVTLHYVSPKTCDRYPVAANITAGDGDDDLVRPTQAIYCRPLGCGMNWTFFLAASFRGLRIVSYNSRIIIPWDFTPVGHFPSAVGNRMEVYCRISVSGDYNFLDVKNHVSKTSQFEFAAPVSNISVTHSPVQLLERGKWVICFGHGHPHPSFNWRVESTPGNDGEREVEIMDAFFRVRDFSEPGFYIMVCEGENDVKINKSHNATYFLERSFTFQIGENETAQYYILPTLILFCIFCVLVNLLSYILKSR